MDQELYVNKRKGRCMAQVLEEFERELEPLLPAEKVEAYKAFVRRKLNGFAGDVIDLLGLDGTERNGAAQEIEDKLFPSGRHPGK